MSRLKPLLKLFGIYGLALFPLLISYYMPFLGSCPFKMITGIPCPGCGGTRALFALMNGDIKLAFYTNPLSVLVMVLAMVAPVWMFIDCLRNTNSLRRVLRTKWHPVTIAIVILTITANWIWNIYKQL